MANQMPEMPVVADRKYKDRVFRAVFKEKKDLLELYNALRGSDYTNPEDLEINTLENAVYMKMKNDLSFLIKGEQKLYEHQSTINPNMPLRGLFYLTDLFRKMIGAEGRKLYGSSRIQIPTPYYVVFYNGTQDQPDRQVMKLSDSYTVKGEEPACLEMTALVLNVNLGHNRELMEKCRKLQEYAQFVAAVRRYHEKEMDLTTAINHAIDECIQNNILAEFLIKNRAEVMDMLWYEYDEEEHIASEKEISYAEGKAEGRTEGEAAGKIRGKAEDILELLEDLGEIPQELRETVLEQQDREILKAWLKLAARVETIGEFENKRKL